MSKDLIKKIIIAAKRSPMPVMPATDKNNVKVDKKPVWQMGKDIGADRALALRNQPSGAHVPVKNKEKTKQKLKNQLRKQQFDD